MHTYTRHVMGLAVLATAFAGAAAAQEPQRGGTLVFAIAAEPPTYDCHGTQTFAVLQRVAPHYSTLLRFEPGKYPNVSLMSRKAGAHQPTR